MSHHCSRAIFTASVVLLPLLGLTWMFGILTVNANSTAFAWLFTIFNSLQVIAFRVIKCSYQQPLTVYVSIVHSYCNDYFVTLCIHFCREHLYLSSMSLGVIRYITKIIKAHLEIFTLLI